MGPWLIHFSQLANNFKIMGHWLIHLLQLATNFKIIGPWLIHFSTTCPRFQDNWDNAKIATSFIIEFCCNKFNWLSAV